MIRPKVAPYRGTLVDPSTSLAQIQKLLFDYNCEAVQVTQARTGDVEIGFVVETEVQGVRRKIAVSIRPPLLAKTAVQDHSRVHVPDLARSYRLLYWWLKAKLEAVSYGIVPVEKEFFANVLVQLEDGSSATVGDLAEESMQKGGSFYLPGLDRNRRPALAPPREP